MTAPVNSPPLSDSQPYEPVGQPLPPGGAGHDQVLIIEFTVDPKQALLFQAILQGEDGFGVIRCFDPHKRIQQFWTTPCQRDAVYAWLHSLPARLGCCVLSEHYWRQRSNAGGQG